MRVLVVSGGRSAERHVSLVSAGWVRSELEKAGHQALDVRIDREGRWSLEEEPIRIDPGVSPWALERGGKELPFDVVFPVLHGPMGEDGTIQGLCETGGWKYAGAPLMGCAVAMDKQTMRLLAGTAGIPMTPWVFNDGTGSSRRFAQDAAGLGFPLFVKPSRMGSSVGIRLVSRAEELPPAIEAALEYDDRVLAEKAVENARELEVSVLGTRAGVRCSVPGEVVPGRTWYDYEAKYDCAQSRLLIPAPVPPETRENLQLLAERAFRLIGGTGFARVDFLMEGGSGEVFFNEINTIPGFTSISMFPKLWQASGLPAEELLNLILDEAVTRPVSGLEKP